MEEGSGNWLIFRAICLAALVVLQTYQVYWACVGISRRWRRPWLAIIGGLMLPTSAEITSLLWSLCQKGEIPAILFLPDSWSVKDMFLLLTTCFLTVLTVKQVGVGKKSWVESISRDSIYEAANQMQMGICFYLENGIPLLINPIMVSLCQTLFGHGFMNGITFWSSLKNEIRQTEENARLNRKNVILPDGKVWRFELTEIFDEGEKVYQVTAMDITAQVETAYELFHSNEELERLNRRFVRYNEEVSEVVREEEILKAKTRIHDRLGQILLKTYHYLSSEEAYVSKQELLKMWENNIQLVLRETEESAEEKKKAEEAMIQAGRAVGIGVHIEGSLGTGGSERWRIFFAAFRECMVNAVRHGHAANLSVAVAEEASGARFCFKNDGILPKEAVRESGGLKSLREMVEKAGGRMAVEVRDAFAVTVWIP